MKNRLQIFILLKLQEIHRNGSVLIRNSTHRIWHNSYSMRSQTGKVIFLIAALHLLSSCSHSLPDFPHLDLGRLQPEVRKAIEQQADRAKANPKDPDQTLRLGMVLHAHDQFQAAQQCYARAHSLDPKRFETLY